MQYSAVHKSLIIEKEDIDRGMLSILWAMKKYRKVSNIPLTRRKHDSGQLSDFDLAEREMLQGLKAIGIDFGVDWGKDLDLSGDS